MANCRRLLFLTSKNFRSVVKWNRNNDRVLQMVDRLRHQCYRHCHHIYIYICCGCHRHQIVHICFVVFFRWFFFCFFYWFIGCWTKKKKCRKLYQITIGNVKKNFTASYIRYEIFLYLVTVSIKERANQEKEHYLTCLSSLY